MKQSSIKIPDVIGFRPTRAAKRTILRQRQADAKKTTTAVILDGLKKLEAA